MRYRGRDDGAGMCDNARRSSFCTHSRRASIRSPCNWDELVDWRDEFDEVPQTYAPIPASHRGANSGQREDADAFTGQCRPLPCTARLAR